MSTHVAVCAEVAVHPVDATSQAEIAAAALVTHAITRLSLRVECSWLLQMVGHG